MTEGWQCPNCGKAHAPHIDTCPEPGRVTITSTFYPRVFHDGSTPPALQEDWPHWPPHLPTVTCDNLMTRLDAAASDAINSDIEGLYER